MTSLWRRLVLLLAALIITTAGIGIWLAESTSGLRWLGSATSRLTAGKLSVEGLEGRLSRSIRAQVVRFVSDDLLVVARDVELNWHPGSLSSGHLEIASLTAGDVEIVSPPSTQPSPRPDNLELPLSFSLHKFGVGALRVMREKGGTPFFQALDIIAGLTSDGRTHRLSELRTALEFGNLTASGQIEGMKPFNVQAQAQLVGLAIPEISHKSRIQPPTGPETLPETRPETRPDALESRISATFSGDLEELDARMKGSGAGLAGEGEARLRPYAPFTVAGLRLSMRGLDPHAFSPGAPKADLLLQADLTENNVEQLEGSLTIENSKPGALDQGKLPLLHAHAHLVLSVELLQLDDLKLTLPAQGAVEGSLAWQLKQARGSANLLIKRVNPASLDTRLRQAGLSGEVKLSGDTENQHGILALRDQKLRMDAHVAMTSETLTLEKMRLRHDRSLLRGEGKLELSGKQAFIFDGRLQHFDISAFLDAPQTDLNATLKLTGDLKLPVTNTTDTAVGALHFSIADSHVAEQPVSGTGRVEFVGIAQAKGEVELHLGINQFLARGGYGREGDQLRLELNAPALAQIGRGGLGGSLTAEAILDSASIHPGEYPPDWPGWPDITFNASGDDLTFPGEHRLRSFTARGALHGEAIALKVSAADYIKQTEPRLQQATLEVEGRMSRHEVRSTVRLNDKQSLSLLARGALNKSTQQWQEAEWVGELAELSGTGGIAFQLKNAAPLQVSSNRLSLGLSRINIAGGEAQIRSIEWSPEKWSTEGYFSGIGLRPGAEVIKGANGRGEVHEAPLRLAGDWNISAGSQLSGLLNVSRESGDWVLPDDPPLPLGLQTLKLAARAADGRLTAELTAKGKRLGEANALIYMPVMRSADSATHWTISPDAALGGNIFVNMQDISWVGPAIDNSNSVRTSGRLALEADVIGTVGTPRLKGQIRGDNLAVASLEQGVRLEQGKLAARFNEESLHMDVLDFTAPHQPPPRDPLLKHLELAKGPGRLRASGVMDLAGRRGNLEITGNLVPLAQRPDRWIIASGTGHVSLENNMLTLKGSLAANAGLLAQPTAGRPHLPDDVIVTGRTEPDGQEETERRRLRTVIEASLDLGERFYINASGLEGRLDGQLRLHGEPGQKLRTIGTITARDTKFEAYGQRLTVERGIVSFQGPIDDPSLNVLALRKGLAVQAGVEVTGSVRHPLVRLVSTPVVSDLEKLSWITLGRAPGGRTDATLLLAAAGSILGGQSGGVTEKISQALGVDELSIRQAGTDPLTGQIGTIGKRLSKEVYISYEQGLAAVAGVTKLTYTLTPKITLVARAGMDNAIDVLYTLSFD